MKRLISVTFVMLALIMSVAGASYAQEGMPAMGPPPEMKEVDGLVGNWDVAMTWYMDTLKMNSKGTATFSKILDGAALKMDYKSQMMGMAFDGLQLFTYDRETKQWQSVWVDNMGARIAVYTGTKKDGKMVMQGEERYMGQVMLDRITTYNQTPTSFDWKMENSMDGGKTWKLSGEAKYTKKEK